MAFVYPEFNGVPGKDVARFLEHMEVACISNHIDDPAQILRLLQIYVRREMLGVGIKSMKQTLLRRNHR